MAIRITVNSTEYESPSSPVTIAVDDDLIISWDPISATEGLGRQPIGQEPAGFGAGIPRDLLYTVVEIRQPDGDLVVEGEPVLPPFGDFYYYSEDNTADFGSYETDIEFRVVQVAPDGRRTEIARVVTT